MGSHRIRPVVIAHRGASGYLPEHTREAKALAYGQGADYLEQDLVATRDEHLVVLHDLHLDDVSDVKLRFPGRRRDDGRFYVVDFTLEEIRRLAIVERRKPGTGERLYPARFADDTVRFSVVTFDEELQLVRHLNRVTGRRVGVYPELKAPAWHAEHGIDLAALLLERLEAFGYRSPDDPIFVQCFEAAALRRLREEFGTRLKLVQLVSGRPSEESVRTGALEDIARYADAVGIGYPALLHPDVHLLPNLTASPLADALSRAGLAMHPYTFRADRHESPAHGFEQLLAFFFEEIGVAGVFCDQPDIAVRVRDSLGTGI